MATPRAEVAFHTEGLGVRYSVYVDPPSRKLRDKFDRWTAVLCLDGDDQFEDLRRARQRLAPAHTLPPLMLVGLGYGATCSQPGNHRVRDYTPLATPEAAHGGGADRFHAFLTDVVWPEIAARYPVRQDERALVGYSLGGLFGLHALFEPASRGAPPFFNRVIAGSPSLWWGERAMLRTIAAAQASPSPLPAPVKLFVSVGLRDSRSMTGDLDLLESQLAARPLPGLELHTARFPGRTHFTAIPITFRTGLAALFGTPRTDCPR